MSEQRKKEYVTFKSVRLPVYPFENGYRYAYPDDSVASGWRYGRAKTRAIARARAHSKAVEIASGLIDLASISQDQAKLCRAFLDLNPTWADIEVLKREKATSAISLDDAVLRFYRYKVSEKGKETKHLKSVKYSLTSLSSSLAPNMLISDIKSTHLIDWLDSQDVGAKRKKTLRADAVALWNWCIKQEVISVTGRFSEPQKTPMPMLSKKEIRFLSCDELRFLLQNVSPDYLPWLIIHAFSGLRTSEIRSWHKIPLDWSMVHQEREIIIVPAELSKNGKRKIIPILPTLREWLKWINPPESGEVIPKPASNSETRRLGELMDKEYNRSEGWPDNVIRHSYATYRSAQEGQLAVVAAEMDNSVAVLRDHYVEAVTKEDADEYFRVTPSTVFRPSTQPK